MRGGALNSSLRVALFTDSFERPTRRHAEPRFRRVRLAAPPPLPGCPRRSRPTPPATAPSPPRNSNAALLSFPLDHDLRCDPLLNRHETGSPLDARLRPGPRHITGPGDVGILGFWAAHSLRVPLVASWHTNLHEYAGRRLDKLFTAFPVPGASASPPQARPSASTPCCAFTACLVSSSLPMKPWCGSLPSAPANPRS